MDGWRRWVPLVVWLSALSTGLAAFHALGQGVMAPPPLTDPGAWGDWLAAREPAVAAVALLRLVVVVLAWYLVGATTVGIVARLVRLAGLVRIADALTLPMVRRLLQGALGVSLAAAMVGASTAPVSRDLDPPRLLLASEAGGDHGGPLSMRLVEPGARRGGSDAVEGSVAMRLAEQDAEAARQPPAADAADGPVEPAGRPVHRVEAGESLWSIARDALTHRRGRVPTDAEITPYWQDVVEHNRSALADPDNPDLIFPGDEIALPEV